VRCLSEGVDVPALDAVLFLTPRNSQVDVVQSVGRVMRNAPGKKRGYVVLPVVIPAGVEPHEALNDNQTYKVVWQVLQALRSHDDRFDAMVNKLDLTGKDPSKMEVIAITDKIQKEEAPPRSQRPTSPGSRRRGTRCWAGAASARPSAKRGRPNQRAAELEFEIGEIERAIYAKLVQKVGNRHHWEDWAKDIAKIARTHIDRITGILENPANVKEREAFDHFAAELRDDLNDSITTDEIIEMLAQHLVTKPVFDALFAGHSFAQREPMSKAMQGVLDVLHEHHLDKEPTRSRFYDSVKLRASGIESAEGKQKIVVELYDKFFRNAFPKMSERLGIVYTPVEVVDFILHSVDHLLNRVRPDLGSEGVHILDPFTGTGTFITRLLAERADLERGAAAQVRPRDPRQRDRAAGLLHRRDQHRGGYHGIVGGRVHAVRGHLPHRHLPALREGRPRLACAGRQQRPADAAEEAGHPGDHREPAVLGGAEDCRTTTMQNIKYPSSRRSIDDLRGTLFGGISRSLYDSYVRAIRWASDRVGESGIIGFVTNAVSSRQGRGRPAKVPGRGVQQPLRLPPAREPAHSGRTLEEGRRQGLWQWQSRPGRYLTAGEEPRRRGTAALSTFVTSATTCLVKRS
jgi:predicted helicase